MAVGRCAFSSRHCDEKKTQPNPQALLSLVGCCASAIARTRGRRDGEINIINIIIIIITISIITISISINSITTDNYNNTCTYRSNDKSGEALLCVASGSAFSAPQGLQLSAPQAAGASARPRSRGAEGRGGPLRGPGPGGYYYHSHYYYYYYYSYSYSSSSYYYY